MQNSAKLLQYSKNLNVLYVEDSPEVAKQTQLFLDDLFSHLDYAEDGVKGLEKYLSYKQEHNHNYDLVITDINMPNLNGIEMSKEILANNSSQSIVIITAHTDTKFLLEAIELGVDAFIIKPMIIDKVVKVFHKVCKRICSINEDKYFIEEATNIVRLMKDGNFSEKIYFNPATPSLINLKNVFNELTDLISGKIEEQTKSLERLNASLEDKVFHQTLELQNQLEAITLARDEAMQAQVVKDEFLTNMSHEIRTPLNAILGFVPILQKRTSEKESKEYLNIIETSGKSLLGIISDILDFSKIHSGEVKIEPYHVDCMEELSSVTSPFVEKAKEKHINFIVDIDNSCAKTINVDFPRVKQISSNLLSNAIKFTPESGEIKVRVTCANSYLSITVKDSGIGISKENQSKVFLAFEQVDGSTTRKYGGTGLGLSLSAKLANLMHGDLTLKSEEGKGSIFTLKIPIEIIGNEPTENLETVSTEEDAEVQFSGSILVAEDNKTNQMMMGMILDDYGLDYKIAKDGLEAVEMYKDDKFDLVLMDENMPNLNGIGAMKQIKEYEKQNSIVHVPIVAVTASASNKDMFFNEGMDGFIAKPIDNSELEKELKKYLKKR